MWVDHEIKRKYLRSDGYVACVIKKSNVPRKNNIIQEHRLVMENKLKRSLSKEEVVHHINKKRCDNRLENLKLMNFNDHNKFHNPKGEKHFNWKEDALKRQPRHVRYLKHDVNDCPDCGEIKDKRSRTCMKCSVKYRKKRVV